jgi:hypothetical protein
MNRAILTVGFPVKVLIFHYKRKNTVGFPVKSPPIASKTATTEEITPTS